jgi:cobaltochelatase CobT
VNSRIVKAVAACARTLTGSDDAEAMLARANVATLGALRAFADRHAVYRRFHDAAIHARHRPDGGEAAVMFEAIEQARLDSLGARWLPGIAHNLLAHPGADEDGLRWLAFVIVSGRNAPREKRTRADAVRDALPVHLRDGLRDLAAYVDDQERFAAAAAAWVHNAGSHLPPSPSRGNDVNRVDLPIRYADRHERRGRYAAPTSTARREDEHRRETSQDAGGGGNPAGATVDASGERFSYRIYTTAYDRDVSAASLASRAELEQLRATLDAELCSVRSVVARLAKRLMRVLMARQVREWRFDLDEGLLDASRLAPMIASRGAARPFKQETDSPFPSTAVTLLIDHSGSMRGRPMQIAALTVEIFIRCSSGAASRVKFSASPLATGTVESRVASGRRAGIPSIPGGSMPWSTSSSRARTCPGGAPAPRSACSCATRC